VPGCRDFIGVGTGNAHLRGYCVDLVIGVARDAYAPRICLPREVTDEQIVRVVVQYIDSQPARLQEDFVLLATEAPREIWPSQAISGAMSACGPKRTRAGALHMSTFGVKADMELLMQTLSD
jgi:hypothetical protein